MQYVLTNKGIVPAKSVVLGDMLYEYGSGIPMKINYIDIVPGRQMYDVRYTDGRVEKVSEDEKVYFNDKLYHPSELYGGILNNIIPIRRYTLDYDKLYSQLDPDPYVAGALLIYGDTNDPYINLPMNRNEADDVLMYKYHITYAAESINDKKYYRYIGSDEKIKWKDFFKGYRFFGVTKIMDDPLIPNEYVYASPADRMQFISGVFDIGYSPLVTPDTVSLTHTDLDKVKLVQTILWSLGVMSYLHGKNGECQLDVIGPEEDYAKFFYNIDFRTRMINNIYDVYKTDPTFELRVESVIPSLIQSNSPQYYFYTEKPEKLYYSAQFLPRVTI